MRLLWIALARGLQRLERAELRRAGAAYTHRAMFACYRRADRWRDMRHALRRGRRLVFPWGVMLTTLGAVGLGAAIGVALPGLLIEVLR